MDTVSANRKRFTFFAGLHNPIPWQENCSLKMFRRILLSTGLTLALLMAAALPAAAHTLTVTISADCTCKYSVSISGSTDANAAVGVDYSFTVTENGNTIPVIGHIDTTADENGNFSATQSNIQLPTSCSASVSFSSGSATLFFNGTQENGFGVTVPSTPLNCSGPPPTGKSLEIGPSSMEGHLQIRPGDWISGGYSFKFVNGGHPGETVTVSSTLTMPFTCPQGGGSGGSFIIDLGTHNYSVPANNTDWQPTGDANNVLSWAGSGKAPDGCSGHIMDNSKGAIWDSNISQSPDTGQLLNWRFKYRDPNAKGKGNVNCLDTSDPRRNDAATCGASWSQTVRDP